MSMKKPIVVFFILLFAASLTVFSSPVNRVSAQGAVRDFSVAARYNFADSGYNTFYPQTLVVQQGDQVNITIRNVGTATFQFNLQGQNSVAVKAGSQNATATEPTDTAVPVFTASSPGIFTFSADKFPEMNGELVVLPSNFSSYSPSSQTRSFTQLVLPDFASDGYDKFFPGVMVVNQGDTVNVTIRNTDDMSHGFAIAAYDLNAAVNPGQDQPNGSIAPFDTAIQPFTASKAGVFRWFCTTPCGPGHFEMVGQLVVLPTQNSPYSPDINTVYSYFAITPDFAGAGYSNCLPDIVFANQNDFVYIEVRNTDTNTYDFSMPGYSVNNVTILAGSSSDPSVTYVPSSSLFADQSGVFEFTYSYGSGTASNQMNGYLVVIPTQNAASTSPSPSPSAISPSGFSLLYAELAIALLIIGVVSGVVVAAIFSRQKQSQTGDKASK